MLLFVVFLLSFAFGFITVVLKFWSVESLFYFSALLFWHQSQAKKSFSEEVFRVAEKNEEEVLFDFLRFFRGFI